MYKWNGETDNFDQVFMYPVSNKLNNNPYLNNFTCFQDVDGDGFSELLVTSSWGWVYCFDTPSPTPAMRVRSELQFYSEYRLGVAEYVAPPIPTAPVIAEENPLDLSVNQAANPTLSVRVTSFQGSDIGRRLRDQRIV